MILYQKISRGVLALLVFLLPLFFLPFLSDSFEAGKQLLLIVLALVSLLVWFGSFANAREGEWRGGWLNFFPALFLLSYFLSSLFSLAGYQTWVGQSLQEYASFTTVAALVAVFYLLRQLAGDLVGQKLFVSSFLLSALAALLLLMNSLFGWLELPWLSKAGANTVGTVNALTIFIIVAAVLALGLWLLPKKSYGFFGLAAIILSLAALILVAAIDFWVLWLLLAGGLALIVIFVFLGRGGSGKVGRLIFPVGLLLVGTIFFFVGDLFNFNLPVVVSPSYRSSFEVVKQTLSEDTTQLLFGSGPGTFVFDYAKYKPLEVNQTIFWSANFDRAKSFFLTELATLGLLGSAAWLLVILSVILAAWRGAVYLHEESRQVFLAIFSGWIILVLAHLLYSSNLTLSFSFWFLIGLLGGLLPAKIKKINLARSPRLKMGFSFGLIVLVMWAVTVLFFAGRLVAAEMAFVKAATANDSGASSEEVTTNLGQAAAWNSWSDVYYRNLSQALLVSAGRGLSKVTADGSELSETEATAVGEVVKAALSAADTASALSSNNVVNWTRRAQIYHEVINLVGGAEDVAAASYLKAVELEPNNPFILASLARLYLSIADRAHSFKTSEQVDLAKQAAASETSSLASAEDYLRQAITLKNDYATAHYYLAAVYERQGRLKEAAGRLEALRDQIQNNLGLGFQLSMMYLRLEDYPSAKAELERLLKLAPNYSNARWYLATIYEVEGNLAAAIAEVEKVAVLNPDNQAVAFRLENLRAGLLAAQMPEPVEEGEAAETE